MATQRNSGATFYSGFHLRAAQISGKGIRSRPTEILGFLERTSVAPDSLAPYLTWDRQHYTRNLIDKTPLYELIAICWEVGQVSSVHNHRDQNCWMAVPIGRLEVENFHLVSQDVEHGTSQLSPTDTVEMNPRHPCAVDPADPVHRVVNPKKFGERAVSLHIYSRPFDTCVVYSPEQGHLRRDQIALHDCVWETSVGQALVGRISVA